MPKIPLSEVEQSMSNEGSITAWIAGLKEGDDLAVQKLWERYFERLVGMARNRLRAVRRGAGGQDEEDVALSALDLVCRGAAEGRFPLLANRDGLWRLLVVVAARKVINNARDARRLKRGGGGVRAEAELETGGEAMILANIVGREPSPDLAAELAESLGRRIDGLGDDVLRQVALARLNGYSYDEIAAQLGCTTRTVIRKIEVIRRHWSEEE